MRLVREMKKWASVFLVVFMAACGGDSDLTKAHKLFEKQKYKEAIQVYTEYIKTNPASVPALYNRGRAFEEDGNPDKALEDYEAVLAIDELHSQANLSVAKDLYFRKENYTQAVKYLDNTIGRDQNNVQAFTLRGKVFQRLGETDKALKDYNAALSVDPEYAEAFFARGSLRLTEGKKRQACADFMNAANLGLEAGNEALKKYCN